MKWLYNLFTYTLVIQTIISSATTYKEHIELAKNNIRALQFDEALSKLKTAMTIRPHEPESDIEIANNLLWLGNQYFEYGLNAKALETYRLILTISNNFASVHHNIGFTLGERYGKHHEALNHLEMALNLNPNNIETHFCAALSYLAIGDLERGFKEYEYRWQRGVNNSRVFLEPLKNLWDGNAPLWGKSFLIRAEQGFGDTIHFIRYAQLLKEKGAFVIAEVQKPLISLLKNCSYIDSVIAIQDPLPPFDYQAPLVSLPYLCKTTLKTIPHKIPYIIASPERVDYWHKQLQDEKRFKIGICWHGDPVHGPGKFMPLSSYIPLLQRTDIAVYSLQRHHGVDQLASLPSDAHLICFDKDFDVTHGSFMDTAAVMQELDLVITADTSTAHLAGALGVPVWVTLPFPAEWRWLIDRHDSPWYPNMTLFRQDASKNWEPVMQKMLSALNTLLTLRSTCIR